METQAVKDLLARGKDLSREDYRASVEALSDDERGTFYALLKKSYFDPKNKVGEPQEKFSPSGEYKVVLETFSTRKGAWNYTQGTLYRVGSDQPLGCIQRNYGAFPHLWVEDHPNGHSYFIGGEDYQGQTVIELDTGLRRDLLPEEAKKGHGFCWASYKYLPEHQLLQVDGCYWACPYEFRFYDFSDPMNGWPLLEVEGEGRSYIDSSEKEPTIDSNGAVTTYQVRDIYDYKDFYRTDDIGGVEWIGEVPEDPEDDERFTIVATKTYLIQDKKLVFQSEWVSEKEQKHREECLEYEREQKAWMKEFKETDPLYLAYREELKKPGLRPTDYSSLGYANTHWCPGFDVPERRWCHRIMVSEREGPSSKGYTIDLEWAVNTGPIKLVIFKDGEKVEDKFWMEHSAESIRAAFAYAKDLVRGTNDS